MKDEDKTKGQLIQELEKSRQQVSELESSESEHTRQLARSESLYRQLVENPLVGVWQADTQGNFVYINNRLAEMSGYSQKEVIGMSMMAPIAPEFRGWLADRMQKRMAGELPLDVVEAEMMRKDGSRYQALVAPATLFDGKGDFSGFIGVMIDISKRERAEEELKKYKEQLEELVEQRTYNLKQANDLLQREIAERKRTAEALRENEEKYRILFDESIDAIYITSREGKFIDANRALLELFGYTREEIIQDLNVREIYVYPDDRDKFQHEIEQKGSVRNYKVKFRKKNGTKIDCLLTATVRQSSDGSILGYQGIIRDVTEYKRAEEALRQSEARYRAIVEDQTELICRFLPDRTITFVNEAYCRYFGKKHEELIGHTFRPLIHEEDRAKVQKHLASISLEKPVSTHEHRVIAANGKIRWQQWTNRMVIDEQQGRVIEFQSVGRDITDRKLMEEALKDSSEKIKLFAYSVSHDLKGPTIGIHGVTRLLHKHYWDVLDEKGRNHCDVILKASEQIAELVEQINEYISTKEAPVTIEKVRLKEILQIVRDEFSTQLNISQIKWSEPECLPEINASRLCILRVLRNLIDNALKYGGENLSQIKIGYKECDDFHNLSVTDDGIGLQKEDSEKIFGIFMRKKTSVGIQGIGLGLAIVKEIAERHRGKVWVEPGPKKGTSFYISISRYL
jgi:PAS domain S-box-containing protein